LGITLLQAQRPAADGVTHGDVSTRVPVPEGDAGAEACRNGHAPGRAAQALSPSPGALPAPGTLEWLADRRPADPAVVDGADVLTRKALDERACSLAEGLAVTHGIGPGDRVALALAPSALWFVASLALAKLGATPAVLPPSHDPARLAAGAGALLLDPEELPALAAPHAVAPRRLSGTHPPAPTVSFTASGEPVVRAFGPERLAAARAPLGDLLARLRTIPGAVHLLAAPLHLAPARLHADVTLVNGGTVVVARGAGPEDLLAPIAEHEVTTAFLAAEQAAALAALPEGVRDGADLVSLQLLLCEGPLPEPVRAALVDLAGDDVLAELRFSPAGGDVLLRGPGEPELRPLAGVSVRPGPGGGLEVRSPLAAGEGWVALEPA
jgi:non-ribosomal peptide synthetase component F